MAEMGSYSWHPGEPWPPTAAVEDATRLSDVELGGELALAFSERGLTNVEKAVVVGVVAGLFIERRIADPSKLDQSPRNISTAGRDVALRNELCRRLTDIRGEGNG